MGRRIIFLDRGHGDKGGKFDPGASSGALSEIVLADGYRQHLRRELETRGHVVYLVGEGPYYQRHRQAAELAKHHPERAAYMQLHLNAGEGLYALCRPDYRSKWGAQLARCVVEGLDLGLPEVVGGRSDEVYPSVGVAKAHGRNVSTRGLQSWWTRGYECIDGLYESPTVCAIIVEPGFIDSAAHAPLWTDDGLRRVAVAIANGVDRWAAL